MSCSLLWLRRWTKVFLNASVIWMKVHLTSSACSFCVFDDSVCQPVRFSWSLTLLAVGGVKQLTTIPQGFPSSATLGDVSGGFHNHLLRHLGLIPRFFRVVSAATCPTAVFHVQLLLDVTKDVSKALFQLWLSSRVPEMALRAKWVPMSV